jgi:hypothetical protein
MPHINTDTIIGITLLAFGVFTFSKGMSQQFSKDNYVKSLEQISNLSDMIICENQKYNNKNNKD